MPPAGFPGAPGLPPGAFHGVPGAPPAPPPLDLGVYQMWNQWVMQMAMAGAVMAPGADAAGARPASATAKPPGPTGAPNKAASKSKKAAAKKGASAK